MGIALDCGARDGDASNLGIGVRIPLGAPGVSRSFGLRPTGVVAEPVAFAVEPVLPAPLEDWMSRFANAFGPHRPEATYVAHAFPEHTYDTGEVSMNDAVAGTLDKPALLLIPGQTESWWG